MKLKELVEQQAGDLTDVKTDFRKHASFVFFNGFQLKGITFNGERINFRNHNLVLRSLENASIRTQDLTDYIEHTQASTKIEGNPDGLSMTAFKFGDNIIAEDKLNCYVASMDNIKHDVIDAFMNVYYFLYLEDEENFYATLKMLNNGVKNAQGENTAPIVIKPIRNGRIVPFQL